jgi:hypothetical protein
MRGNAKEGGKNITDSEGPTSKRSGRRCRPTPIFSQDTGPVSKPGQSGIGPGQGKEKKPRGGGARRARNFHPGEEGDYPVPDDDDEDDVSSYHSSDHSSDDQGEGESPVSSQQRSTRPNFNAEVRVQVQRSLDDISECSRRDSVTYNTQQNSFSQQSIETNDWLEAGSTPRNGFTSSAGGGFQRRDQFRKGSESPLQGMRSTVCASVSSGNGSGSPFRQNMPSVSGPISTNGDRLYTGDSGHLLAIRPATPSLLATRPPTPSSSRTKTHLSHLAQLNSGFESSDVMDSEGNENDSTLPRSTSTSSNGRGRYPYLNQTPTNKQKRMNILSPVGSATDSPSGKLTVGNW